MLPESTHVNMQCNKHIFQSHLYFYLAIEKSMYLMLSPYNMLLAYDMRVSKIIS